ncbi:hypothetical protein OEZ85_003861 [Tetradesmus obliquus]|uniref:Uncharacterized protein n=1 Tax=Tetradesmus obliquus TaxID=3088 RepID=A0ABY8UFM4_TETOB|nr:hypothetical protein OEZ85_003861 [Tetradesmus obliquus]
MDERLVEAAQALLTGYDTALSRQWREEDRKWRTEDMCWRQKELYFSEAQHSFLEEQRQWRQEDIEQRHLENARALWARVVEKNRRDVEEKSEQLKAISTLAALISGFALSAFLQFDFGNYVDTSGAVLPLFGVTMALTVGLETICVIICSLMLVSVFKTGQNYMSEEEEAEFMNRCKAFADSYGWGDRPPAPARSFAMHWAQRCEQSWRRAFLLFGLGIPCLFANLSVAAWIKFDHSLLSQLLTTIVLVLALVSMGYSRKWSAHILETERTELGAERVPTAPQGLPFDWHRRPAFQGRTLSQRMSAVTAGCSSDGAAAVGVNGT